jgi:2-keto-myo-inositol isomerase
MIERKRLALNRITCPGLSIPELLELALELEVNKIELRNDLGDGRVTDGLTPLQVKEATDVRGIEIIAINALQSFNLGALREQTLQQLEQLIETARSVGCPAIVMCPNNALEDVRPAAQKYQETVEALEATRPLFERNDMVGLVQPLGFVECSLRSGREALRAVDAVGGDCFKLVHDTFHHHLGPDGPGLLDEAAYAATVGLVHLSGVEADIPREELRDPHRVLPGEGDRLGSRDQIERLIAAGFDGPVSLVPFAAEVHALERDALNCVLEESIDTLS